MVGLGVGDGVAVVEQPAEVGPQMRVGSSLSNVGLSLLEQQPEHLALAVERRARHEVLLDEVPRRHHRRG